MRDEKPDAGKQQRPRPVPWPAEVESEQAPTAPGERKPPLPSYDDLQHQREQVGKHFK